MATTVRFVSALLILIASTVIARTAMWAGPALVYALRAPAIGKECMAIRPGMTFAEMEAFIHSKAWPKEESLANNNFSFGHWTTCNVQLEPATQKVVRAEVVAEPGGMK